MLSVQPCSFTKFNYSIPAKKNVSFGISAEQVAGETMPAIPVISRALKVDFSRSNPYAMLDALHKQPPLLDQATIDNVVRGIDAMYHH